MERSILITQLQEKILETTATIKDMLDSKLTSIEALLEELQRLIRLYVKEKIPKTYLFEKGNAPMNSAQLRYILTKLFKEAGLKVTPHQLRHSFATHLLNNGARIADVSELLGHETMATTQVYTKLGSVKKMQEYMKAHPLAKS